MLDPANAIDRPIRTIGRERLGCRREEDRLVQGPTLSSSA